jgi:hypothetical protein
MTAYCARCRQPVAKETYNFWQGTAWCESCRSVVRGTLCKVPVWILTTIVVLAMRITVL